MQHLTSSDHCHPHYNQPPTACFLQGFYLTLKTTGHHHHQPNLPNLGVSSLIMQCAPVAISFEFAYQHQEDRPNLIDNECNSPPPLITIEVNIRIHTTINCHGRVTVVGV